ncbi:hypothetical protein [Streptomyces sp. NRRL S-1813]|uniref:hypothetical protein n=1 Tax=Streptomyces sp. NRRL S-1813 TaxID=1463888 RepID=UPI00131D9193|nr:hypothetical protein [Streptomyces sp. NRRL S-1813]
MRVRIRTCLPVVAAIVAGSALLTACNDDSGSSSDNATSPSQTTSAPAPSDTSAAGTPSTSASAVGADSGSSGSPVTVNKSFTDDVMGEKATVLKYVSGYQPSAASKSKYSALADEEVVLVQVKVTASSKYYDSFGAGSFYLTGMPNGIDQASTTILDDEIKAAGYPPLPDAETGKTTTGWVVFNPGKDTKKLVLRYKRLAAKTSNGTSISAKNFDIPLN